MAEYRLQKYALRTPHFIVMIHLRNGHLRSILHIIMLERTSWTYGMRGAIQDLNKQTDYTLLKLGIIKIYQVLIQHSLT